MRSIFHIIFSKFPLFLICCGSALNSISAYGDNISDAANSNWYQIEYIVFKHLDSDMTELAYENHHPVSLGSSSKIYLVDHFTPLSPSQKKKINKNEMMLSGSLDKLEKNISVQVLNYGAWIQSIENDTILPELPIAYTFTRGSYAKRLEGSLTVKRSRYLHTDFKLAINDYAVLPYTHFVDWLIDSNPLALDSIVLPLSHLAPYLYSKGSNELITSSIKLMQSRRIKDAEIHYIDHPMLGVITTIKKVPHPDADLDAFE